MAPKAIEVLLGVIHISFWLALLVPGAGASLIPVGRALASIDPSAAADFFVRVLPGSFRVEQNFSSTSPECDVEIAAVRLPYGAQPDGAGQLIYFVRDGVAPWGDAPLEPYVSQQVADFDAQANGSLVYDRWEDQHDGAFRAAHSIAETYVVPLRGRDDARAGRGKINHSPRSFQY